MPCLLSHTLVLTSCETQASCRVPVTHISRVPVTHHRRPQHAPQQRLSHASSASTARIIGVYSTHHRRHRTHLGASRAHPRRPQHASQASSARIPSVSVRITRGASQVHGTYRRLASASAISVHAGDPPRSSPRRYRSIRLKSEGMHPLNLAFSLARYSTRPVSSLRAGPGVQALRSLHRRKQVRQATARSRRHPATGVLQRGASQSRTGVQAFGVGLSRTAQHEPQEDKP